MNDDHVLNPADYAPLLERLKERIARAQVKAALAVSRELILLYWQIGRDIVIEQEHRGWGDGVLDRIAAGLKASFPGVEGFSRRNLYRMRSFYLAYRDGGSDSDGADGFVPQAVAQIPWGHNAVLLERVKDASARLWYAVQAAEQGWSRAVLEHQIASGLYERQGKALTNFAQTLPPPQSDLARQVLKDPYNFDFLTLASDAKERHLEEGLRTHIREFLLEMGAGFAFLGTQYPVTVGDREYYLDLLFYHVRLRCYVVVDLKVRDFEPEFAGKMNFYLSAVDDLLRHPDDSASIGIILCKGRDRVTVEYALRRNASPIGVAEYLVTEALPDTLRDSLPTVEALEAELDEAAPPDAGGANGGAAGD